MALKASGSTKGEQLKLLSYSCCEVCGYNFKPSKHMTRHCCKACVCAWCMYSYIRVKIEDGVARIPCPKCTHLLTRDEVNSHIDYNRVLKEKYDRILVDTESDGSLKTCPRCCLITEHKLPRQFRLKEKDVKLRCTSCDLEWCFKCHAPWHEGATCKAFRTGEKQFRDWTKGTRVETGDANCRQCPTCRVYIERKEGCDHMTCSRCDSEFCYKCGELYTPIAGHRNPLSVFGCKYSYDGHPAERLAIRGGYLAAKVACLTAYPALFVGGAVVLLAGSVVIIPIYIGYRVYNYRLNTRRYHVNRR